MPISKNKNNKLTLILTGVITVLILAVGAAVFSFMVPNDNSANASILENQTFLDATQEYKNDTLGFNIRYYSNWSVGEIDSGVAFYTNFDEVSDSYVENLTVRLFNNFSLDDYKAPLTVQSSEDIQIDTTGVTKIISVSSFGPHQIQSVSYIFTKDTKTFVLQYTGQIGGGYDRYLAPAEEMVQSFKD